MYPLLELLAVKAAAIRAAATSPVSCPAGMAVRLAPDPLNVVAVQVVKAPVFGVVLPMGPGDANRAVTPAPETVPEAESVVNAPAFGVVEPTGPGASNVLLIAATSPLLS